MSKYRRIPYEIEATQFFSEIQPYPAGVYDVRLEGHFYTTAPFRLNIFNDNYPNSGWQEVRNGDWIITYHNGRHESMPTDKFEQTYEKVEE